MADLEKPLVHGQSCKWSSSHSPLRWDFVVVFPLPKETTEDDEIRFKKKFLHNGMKHKDVLLQAFHPDHHEAHADALNCKDSLKSLRCAVIETLRNLVKSIGKKEDGTTCSVFEFTSMDNDEFFLCVQARSALAEKLADLGEYPLQLSNEAVEKKLNIKITEGKEDIVPAYVKYDEFMKDKGLLQTHQSHSNPEAVELLHQSERIRLIYDKVSDYFNIDFLEHHNLILHMYPSHNRAATLELTERWASGKYTFTFEQPLDHIAHYFGEAIAFYFLFVETMQRGLFFLMIFLAFPISTLSLLENFKFLKLPDWWDDASVVACSTCITLWFTILCKAWRRRAVYYNNRWGGDQFPASCSIKERVNPRFDGTTLPSELDENIVELRAPPSKVRRGMMKSWLVTILWIVFITSGLAANQSVAAYVHNHNPDSYLVLITGLGLTVQIKVFGFIWGIICPVITTWECHVNKRDYIASTAIKTFLVNLVNTFFAFFYMAYFQNWMDVKSCGNDGCKGLLKYNLNIVYVTYISFGFLGMVIPVLQSKIAIWLEARALVKTGKEAASLSFLEAQAKMPSYSGDDSINDYMQVVFPVSFIGLFGALMPVSIFFCFLAMCTQKRADAWKLVNAYRRPFPMRADGIGPWDDVMKIFNYLAIFNNIGVLLFQVPFIDNQFDKNKDWKGQMLVFFVMQNIYVGFYLLYNTLVSDTPARTRLEMRRQALQRIRVLGEQNVEFSEEIHLGCTGCDEEHAFHGVPPLTPGHAMYEL